MLGIHDAALDGPVEFVLELFIGDGGRVEIETEDSFLTDVGARKGNDALGMELTQGVEMGGGIVEAARMGSADGTPAMLPTIGDEQTQGPGTVSRCDRYRRVGRRRGDLGRREGRTVVLPCAHPTLRRRFQC